MTIDSLPQCSKASGTAAVKTLFSFVGRTALCACVASVCLISNSLGAAPKVESFPEFITWEDGTLPVATATGGTPPYKLTIRVADSVVPLGFDFRVDPINGPLVAALKRELQYHGIGPRRVQEFLERAGRVPNGVPLHTHIFVTGTDATGIKFRGRFTTLIEIPDNVRQNLLAVITGERDAKVQEREAKQEQEFAQQRAKKQAEQAKALADWRPGWGLIALLFGVALVLGSLVNSLCLKLMDAIESLFRREMEWMSTGTIILAAVSIAVAAFVAAGLLGVGARGFAYYVAEARTPDAIVIWGTVAASFGMLLAIAGVLWMVCRCRGLRLVARTLGFLTANVALALGIGLLTSAIMSPS